MGRTMASKTKKEDLPDFTRFRALVKGNLAELVQQRLEFKRQRMEAEEAIKTLDYRITGLMEKAGFTAGDEATVMVDETRVTYAKGTNSHLNAKKLMDHGVDAAVIKECTDKKEYTYILVTPPKEKDNEGE